MIIEEIKNELKKAEQKKCKTAKLHFLSLKYAQELMGVDPKELCKELGLKASMASEIRKMRAVHLLMKEENLKL